MPTGIVSTGWPAVRDTCTKMGVTFDRWQDGLGRGILAKRKDGLYAAGIGGIIISICRQVGKTYTIGAIIFALCIIFPRLTVIWTAHHSRTSDETFESLQSFARRKKVKPYIRRIRRANGQQQIIFANGSRILFGARENGFGRGFAGVDVVVMDEFQILTNKALEDMIPATNAAPNPLIIGMGTPPRPVDPGEAFRTRRNEALEIKRRNAAGDPVECEMLYLEVGADPDADLDDWGQVEKANPSHPHRVPRQSILRVRKNLADDDSYRREGLGIWDDDRDTARAIPEARWAEGETFAAPDTAPAYGISFSADGMRMALGAAKTDGARMFLEQLDADEGAIDDGMVKLADWFAAKDENGVPRWRRSRGIFISGSAHAPTFKQLLRRRKVLEKWITVLNTPQVMAACQTLDNELKAKTILHPEEGQERLDASIAVATKMPRSKDGGWTWGALTPDGDETPTEAISFALWGARISKLTGRMPGSGRGGGIL
ncbi:terminase [Leucobacter muris]|uniref:Terminase n=1 Tax=Leucobacter muris TaxID=1935379 RepID=A0ABX5QES1_9MICO|nr:terminase family protein [Leucobacter muris]QAB17475.1 terminase [Leucobacter muris]